MTGPRISTLRRKDIEIKEWSDKERLRLASDSATRCGQVVVRRARQAEKGTGLVCPLFDYPNNSAKSRRIYLEGVSRGENMNRSMGGHGMAEQTGFKGAGPDATPKDLVSLIAGKWVSQAIFVAAELGIADMLKDGARSAKEIAKLAGASEDAVYRLLRALASLGLFSSLADRRFELAPSGAYLRSDVPGSLRGWARFMGHDFTWRPWGHLTHSVRTGRPAFDHVFGTGIFDYIAKHPDAAAVLNDAMTALSTTESIAIAEAYDFSRIRTLVDVGGGQGHLLATIVKGNPGMRGILFELPHAVPGATDLFQREGLADRCSALGGDFFDRVPAGGDAYIMRLVIHDWDDERASQILRNCHRVMQPRDRLLVVERVISADDVSDVGKFNDLEMLVLTAGGRERTEADFRSLYERVGFDLTRIVPTASTKCVIEGARK
jgi:hypothetical protein